MTDAVWPFLRNQPDEATFASLSTLEVDARSAPPSERARALGRLGDCQRALRHPAAVATLVVALDCPAAEPLRVANRLRLATAHFYDGASQLAETELRALEADAGPRFDHYATQHLGKCLAEQRRFDAAATQFARALEIRRERKLADSLMTSAATALAEAQRRARLDLVALADALDADPVFAAHIAAPRTGADSADAASPVEHWRALRDALPPDLDPAAEDLAHERAWTTFWRRL